MQSPSCAWPVRNQRDRATSHGPIARICARYKIPCGTAAPAAAHKIVAVMNVGSPSVYYAAARACDPLVAIVRLEVGHGRIAQFALVAIRRGHGRNTNLAVAVVEVGVLPGGVLLLLRCFDFH